MKKTISLLLSLAMALSLAACGKSSQEAAPSQEAASSQDPADAVSSANGDVSNPDEVIVPAGYELKVAFSQDNAPFSYVDESGNLTGVDVEIAQALCERNQWTLNAQAIDWSEHSEVLSGKEVDCIWGAVSYSEANNSDAGLFWSVYGGMYVDATVLDESDIITLSDLKGKRVEIEPSAMYAVKGESATKLGKQLAKDVGALEQVKDANTAYQDLADKKCDAILVSGSADDTVDFESFGEDVVFRAVYDKDIYTEDADGSEEGVDAVGVCDYELGAGFAEDSDVFIAVNQTLESMLVDGSVESILQSWSEKDNGAYADAVRRCTVYQTEEFDPEMLGDESVDWDSVDLEDLEDLEEGSEDQAEAEEEAITDEDLEEDNSTIIVK